MNKYRIVNRKDKYKVQKRYWIFWIDTCEMCNATYEFNTFQDAMDELEKVRKKDKKLATPWTVVTSRTVCNEKMLTMLQLLEDKIESTPAEELAALYNKCFKNDA